MIAQVGRRGHAAGQFAQVAHAAGFLQRTQALQLLGYRQDVYRLLLDSQGADGLVDMAVLVLVERLRTQQVGHGHVGLFLQHQGAQHRIFQFRSLWRQFAYLVGAHLDDGGSGFTFIVF